MRTTTELRRLVTRPQIAFLMEAHDGLSARVAEEAGFEGIWASACVNVNDVAGLVDASGL
jgi:2-methylisocitrate lyase-like PEP mutase family enzyme